jgi:hypothetical protein
MLGQMAKTLYERIFESSGVNWVIAKRDHQPYGEYVSYAMCRTKKCLFKLDFAGGKNATCPKCHKKYSLNNNYEEQRSFVDSEYQASKFWNAEVINLELLPTHIAQESSDENYWILSKLGQKDGKRTLMVLVGDKNSAKGEKVQLFVDIDGEQIRWDKSNLPPGEIIVKFAAIFKKSKVQVIKK